MKIISWNVNGIRSAIKKGFFDFLEKENADVYLLQEVKISEKDLGDIPVPKGYTMYHFLPEKKGYAGLIAYCKGQALAHDGSLRVTNGATPPCHSRFSICRARSPLCHSRGGGNPVKVINGLEVEVFDLEARVMALEFDKFYILNAYFPHSRRELARLDFKLEFNEVFQEYVKELGKKKPVIIGGDFNVAHEARDLANPKSNEKNAGFTMQEREWFDGFLKNGFTDTFRMFEEGNGHYTWWSNRKGVRERNIGWRIDYFLVSKQLEKKVKNSRILDKVHGSDHCPIELELNI